MQDQDFSFEAVAEKSVKGIFALISRTFFLQILSVIASFILTLYLDPSAFGVFFVVSSLIVFFNYFQDIGLAASLIQKKSEPTLIELRTAFTVQQALVFVVCLPALIFSNQISRYYGLNQQGEILFIVLLLSFIITTFRTIPTVILERRLDYKKLVIPQIGENLVYNVSLIVCAVMGLSVTSFTIAIFLRSIVGLVLTYYIQPWGIGLAFDKDSFKRLVHFGIPFQANNILALIKDDFLTIYLGKALSLTQVGYIGFAQKWAFLPLRLVMDNVIKITFPSFSRLQHDPKALRIAIEKSLFLISSFIFPAAIGIILFSPYFIAFVPRYHKWEPALLSLSFFALNTIFSSISTPLTNFFNAIGKVKITLYFMIFWTIMTWVSTVILIRFYDYNGVALASFIVSLSSVFVIVLARSYVTFSIAKPVFRQLVAAFAMGIFIFATREFIYSFPLLIVEVILSFFLYCLFLYFLAKKELSSIIRFVISSVRK